MTMRCPDKDSSESEEPEWCGRAVNPHAGLAAEVSPERESQCEGRLRIMVSLNNTNRHPLMFPQGGFDDVDHRIKPNLHDASPSGVYVESVA